MNTQDSFPLAWPAGWPRTPIAKRRPAPFFTLGRPAPDSHWRPKTRRSMNDTTDDIIREVRALGGQQLVISTNVELRQDGLPYSNRRPPDDAGAAVYFKLKAKPASLACDKWNRVEDNLYAIAKHIEALRGQERWGVGSVEQAFAGYMALPPAGSSAGASWWNVLGCAHDAPFDVVREAYRDKARAAHPDNGGSHDAMVQVNAAWDQARAAFDLRPV